MSEDIMGAAVEAHNESAEVKDVKFGAELAEQDPKVKEYLENAPEARKGKAGKAAQAKATSEPQAEQSAPDPAAIFGELLKEEAATQNPQGDEDLGDQDGSEDQQEEGAGGGRANKRIRYLNSQLKEVRQQTAQMQQQWQAWGEQAKNAVHQLQLENAKLRAQLEARAQVSRPAEDPNDPLSSIRKQLGLDSLPDTLKSQVSQYVEPLQNELKTLREELQKKEQQAKYEQTAAQYRQATAQAARDILLKDARPEDVASLQGPLETLILAASYGYKARPQEAAHALRRLILQAGQAIVNGRASGYKKAAPSAPSVTSAARAPASAKGPSVPAKHDDLVKAGYKDELDFMFKNPNG